MNLLAFPVVSEYTVFISIYQSLEKEVSSIQYAGHIRAIYLKDTFLSGLIMKIYLYITSILINNTHFILNYFSPC